MDSSGQIIAAADIHREFRTVEGVLPVLKGIDLQVRRNEMLAVTGASGVGWMRSRFRACPNRN
jgi:predicted ABC-type transport system involved in lysophospholipase L1 biosynthesis ATPase subunit